MYKPLKRAYLWKSGLDIIDIFMLLEDCLIKRENVWLEDCYKHLRSGYTELKRHDIECLLEEMRLRREENKGA